MKRILYIDADTLLYAAASQQESRQCLAKNRITDKEKLFESKTKFNEWHASNSAYDKTDYEFTVVTNLVGRPEYAFQSIKQKVDKIFNASYCDEFFVCIQGEGNFRKEYETSFVEYKGHRADKPILFNECFEYMKKKYKERCIVSSGIETDDFINTKAWESYNLASSSRKKSDAPFVIAYCDKDIVANGRGWFLNYNKLDEGVFWVDGLTQTRNYFIQVLMGDNADNIPGIIQLGDYTKSLYGIKTKGVGIGSATKILKDCIVEEQMARNVVEAYKDAWPQDWKQRLADNCFFLYLQRYEGEQFNVDEFFGRYEIQL